MDFINNLLATSAGLFAILIALIPLIVTIALIVAIFQINGRLGEIMRLQRISTARTIETAELQRQTFIALLAEGGPNHKEYLDYLVDLEYITQYQAEFVLKQSGNEVVPDLELEKES